MTDSALLAVTLQDTVLQKMSSHERFKDLTSRMLNGETDKPAKLCAAEGGPALLLKGSEPPPPPPHAASPPQRKGSSPELKLQITKLVSHGRPHFEPPRFPSEDGVELARTLGNVREQGKKRKRPLKATPKPKPKPKPKPRPLNGPVASPVIAAIKDGSTEVLDKVEPVAVKEEEPEVRFSVGDVVWAKVNGYPWWPCMVTTDPVHNKHVKKKAVISRTILMYHVQYFSDMPERGYVSEKIMVPFEGEEQYQELCQRQTVSCPNRKKDLSSIALRGQWNTGISQATRAIGMALEERMAKFTFTYTDDEPQLNPHVQEGLEPEESAPPADPCLPLPHCSTSQAKKTALKKTPNGTKSAERTKPPLPAKGKPRAAKASKDKQPQRPTLLPSQVPIPAFLGEGPQKSCPLSDGGLLKKTTQLVVCLTGLPLSTTSPEKPLRPKPHPAKERTKAKTKSDLKGQKKVEVQKRPHKRLLSALEEEPDESPKKRIKSDSTPAVKRKLRAKPAVERKKKASVASQTTTSGSKTLKKKRQWRLLSPPPLPLPPPPPPPPAPRKPQAPPCPEPEVCEQRAESPRSDSTDETHPAKKGERNGAGKKENVCPVCEEAGEDLLPCEGQCCGTFHLQCLGLPCRPPGKLLCPECSSGLHACFSCKQAQGEVRRCMVQQCGRFYHEACARLSALAVFEAKGFRCPLHTCLSCHYSLRSRPKASKGKMMRCVKCPVAYHSGEQCVAAGSEMLTSGNIICTNHFTAKKGYSHHSHVNVSWCFVCSKGGSLLCCESCPAAFHPDCLNIAMPDGSWYCNDCKAGKKPKYRDIIWVKLGNYRWWPAEVRHPRTVPSNIQHLRHEIGEFPVFFFGSKDYFWTHQGRVFPYMEGDRGSKYQKTGIGKVFKNALLEAESRFKEIKQEREAKEAQENARKPPPYKHVKVNKPCGRVQIYTADISEIPKCNCRPGDEKPCGFESECLNRMLMYECHPQVCPAGDRCHNQGFTKRQYPDTKTIKTAGKGWGLLALRDIKKGEFVNEYVGELIDEVECRARIKYAQENDITHFYMLTIDKDRIIDAGPKGNYSRFMNHSCQPNCETQKWTVNGDTRVGLFAVCDIPAGTELTFNYNLDCLGNEKTVCRCGAPNCSGFLGDRPKNSSQASEVKGKKLKKKQKKRRPRSEGKRSEDECFRCGDGGELVLCDRKSCTKAYHLSCLDRTKRPFGRWDCPWHHCDVCGKNSEVFCQLCPNSFCKAHQEGALRMWAPTGQLCCQEHEDMELRPILDRREAEVALLDGPRGPKSLKRS
ncbi:LOW QUALITY PROTEIN: histone-lysine N-methyltransferase NSD2 [Conger conger]|uniref:LOW QUALITY PROTEIN: histone-lysine N-methyltransferase NSD2 n=1 Tax=Conger conger TaxID=82655 RepID=UPI002A5A8E29|nr:LOW QUALITY PROTEIN: histone-lysine N-methyltransferase NSD2 [Conger conger]